MAMGSPTCSNYTFQFLKDIVTNSSYETEFRIEAYKGTYRCRKKEALDFAELVSNDTIYLNSTQVKSYLSSYSNERRSTSFQLSGLYQIDVGKLFGHENHTVVSGDVIFSDSFIPRLLSLKLNSKWLGPEEIIQFSIRQTNLEDLLQPIFGPDAVSWTFHTLIKEVVNHFLNKNGSETMSTILSPSKIGSLATNMLQKISLPANYNFKSWISAGFGSNVQYFGQHSIPIIGSQWKEKIKEISTHHLLKWMKMLINEKVHSVYLNYWKQRRHNLWTYLGNVISIKEYGGMMGGIRFASQIKAFSVTENSTQLDMNLLLSPSVAIFDWRSLELRSAHQAIEHRISSTSTLSFDAKIKSLEKNLDTFQVLLDLPLSSYHGYKEKNIREIIETGKWNSKTQQSPNSENANKYKQCYIPMQTAIGLSACWRKNTVYSAMKNVTTNQCNVEKMRPKISSFMITVLPQSLGPHSYFITTDVQAVGIPKKSVSFVLGMTGNHHPTLKLLTQYQNVSSAFEATLVNDFNLKRFEARSNVGENEYGVKAEVLLMRDGMQTNIKPRLILSKPENPEDSLLEGYLGYYSSKKFSSFMLDFSTDGSLAAVFDFGMNGSTEYRKNGSDWLLSIPHMSLTSREIDMNVTGNFSKLGYEYGIITKLDINEESAILRAKLQRIFEKKKIKSVGIDIYTSYANESSFHNEIQLSYDASSNKKKTQFIWYKGHNGDIWMVNLDQSVNISPNERSNEDGDVHISTNFKISLPISKWLMDMRSTIQRNVNSIENKVDLRMNNKHYLLLANLYDRSKKWFSYDAEIKVNLPDWRISYYGNILQRAKGNFIAQSTALTPAGLRYVAFYKIKYIYIEDQLILVTSQDYSITDVDVINRYVVHQSLVQTPSYFEAKIMVDSEYPLLISNIYLGQINTEKLEANGKLMIIDVIESGFDIQSRNQFHEIRLYYKGIPRGNTITSYFIFSNLLPKSQQVSTQTTWKSSSATNENAIGALYSLRQTRTNSYEIRTNLNVYNKIWKSVADLQLNNQTGILRNFVFNFHFPSKERVSSKYSYLINEDNNATKLEISAELIKPFDDDYKIVISSSGSLIDDVAFKKISLILDTPLTKEVIFHSTMKRNISLVAPLNGAFECFSFSKSDSWKPIDIVLNFKDLREENGFVYGQTKTGIFDFVVNATIDKTNYKNKTAFGLIEYISKEGSRTQYKFVSGGELVNKDGYTMLKQRMNIESNYKEAMSMNGSLKIEAPHFDGNITVASYLKKPVMQKYVVKGKLFDGEVDMSLEGDINTTPLLVTLNFLGSEKVKFSGMYENTSYASIGFVTNQKLISSYLESEQNKTSRIVTTGFVIWKKKKTNFFHVVRSNSTSVSTVMRVKDLEGNPLKVTVKREKLSNAEYITNSRLAWGNRKMDYNDYFKWTNIRNFVAAGHFSAPFAGIDDVIGNMTSLQNSIQDQHFDMYYVFNEVVIYSAKLDTLTSYFLIDPSNWTLNVSLTDVIYNRTIMDDISLNQVLDLKSQNEIQIYNKFTKGLTPFAEFGAFSSAPEKRLLASVCYSKQNCLKIHGANSYEIYDNSISYTNVNLNLLNTLQNKNNTPIIQIAFGGSLGKGIQDKRIMGSFKIEKRLCKEVNCDQSIVSGMHKLRAKLIDQHLVLGYRNLNRTIEMATKFSKNIPIVNRIGKRILHGNSSTVVIDLWLNKQTDEENVLSWNTNVTSYNESDNQEITSLLTAPQLSKPLKLTAKISPIDIFSSRCRIIIDVFPEAANAVLVDAVVKYGSQIKSVEATIQNMVNKRILGDVKLALLPQGLLTFSLNSSVNDVTSSNKFINFACISSSSEETDQTKCELMSVSRNSTWLVSKDTTSQNGCWKHVFFTELYQNPYSFSLKNCHNPWNIASELKISDDYSLHFGFVSLSHFSVKLLDVLNMNISLYPPFILHWSAAEFGNMENNLKQIQNSAWREVTYLSQKTKGVALDFSNEAFEVGSEIVFKIMPPGTKEELSSLVGSSLDSIVTELSTDQIFGEFSYVWDTFNYLYNEITTCLSDMWLILQDIVQISTLSQIYTTFSQYASTVYVTFITLVREIIFLGSEIIHTSWREMSNTASKLFNYVIRTTVRQIPSFIWNLVETFIGEEKLNKLYQFYKKSTSFYLMILSYFYEDIHFTAEDEHMLIPLPQSSYTLYDVYHILDQKLPSHGVCVPLSQEINSIWNKVLEPIDTVVRLLPPYKAQAVLYGGSIINFNGKISNLNKDSGEPLLSIMKSNPPFSIHIENKLSNRNSLIIEKPIKISLFSSKNVIEIDNGPAQLPHIDDNITVTRDRNFIYLTLLSRSSDSPKVFLMCNFYNPSCLVEVSGWYHSDVTGALGPISFENFHNNDTKNNQLVDFEIKSPLFVLSGLDKVKKICRKIFFDVDSLAIPCYRHVNVDPFYEMCLSQMKTSQESINGDNGYHLDTNVFQNISSSEENVLCGVLQSYLTMCSRFDIHVNIDLICKRPPGEDELSKKMLVDVLLVLEQTSDVDFYKKHFVENLKQPLMEVSSRADISTNIGAMAYGRIPNEIIYYGKGINLMLPLNEFVTPSITVANHPHNSLVDVLQNILNYEFRSGSVRIVFLMHCSGTDISRVSDDVIEELLRKRIIIYTFVNDKLPKIHKYGKSDEIVGYDSKFAYHLRNNIIFLTKKSRKYYFTTKLANVAIKTGGGVFSINNVKKSMNSTTQMDDFTKIVSSAVLFLAKTIYTGNDNN